MRATGSGETRGSGGRRLWVGLVALLVVGVSWTVIAASADAVGPGFRRAAMVQIETSPSGSTLAFDDATDEAGSFLIARDSVSIEVPWTMTVDQLLRLYHLENNQSAKLALEAQFGGVDLGQVLPEGTRLKFALTPSERGAR